MNKRIAEIRKYTGLNQVDFAAKLNLTKNFISLLETGGRDPSDRTISDICREFNVSESWLRTGEGDPFVKLSREEEMAQFVGDVMRGGSDSDIAHVLHTLAGATPEEIHAICQFALRLAKDFRQE